MNSRKFWSAVYDLLEKMQDWIYVNKIPYRRPEGRNPAWEHGKYLQETPEPKEAVQRISDLL